jgi:hypothetical protein
MTVAIMSAACLVFGLHPGTIPLRRTQQRAAPLAIGFISAYVPARRAARSPLRQKKPRFAA